MSKQLRGDIYLADLGYQSGSIQGGCRPVLIVQNNKGNEYAPTTIICPITSATKTRLPTHVYLNTSGGLYKESIVLCEQVTTINKEQLKEYLGTINESSILTKINRALSISLGLSEEHHT